MNFTLATDRELLTVLRDDYATEEDKKHAATEIMVRKGGEPWNLIRENHNQA